MNPCHPLCFFSYFLHEEIICLVAAQTRIFTPSIPSFNYYSSQVAYSSLCTSTSRILYTCLNILSHQPHPHACTVQPTAYFHSNSKYLHDPHTLLSISAADPHSFASHSKALKDAVADTLASLSTRVKTKSEVS